MASDVACACVDTASAMTAVAVRCQWRDGSVSHTELAAGVDPAQWTAHDAREAIWANQRTLHAAAVHAVRLVDVDLQLNRL